MQINLNYIFIILTLILFLKLWKLFLSKHYSRKFRKICDYEFKNIRCNVYREDRSQLSLPFNTIKKKFNIYIYESVIYLLPTYSMSIFGDDILSTALYFEEKETQIIDKIYTTESNRIKIEYYPLDILSILNNCKYSSITLIGLNDNQKTILKYIIDKYCS